MKRLLLTGAAIGLATGAAAQDTPDNVSMGVLLSFTGPIESLTPAMAEGAELAISEASGDPNFFGGATLEPVRADATCVDAAAATAAAERMVTSDGVSAIMGADCSGATTAVLANVAVPNGVAMISPASTSPALTDIEDDGLFFRTAPSDARQGEVLATILSEEGIDSVALTYTNNDYGTGFAQSFTTAFEATGGTVTLSASHEDGRGDYSAEVGALASAGGDALVVLGYVDQGGAGIIRSAIDTGAFDMFAFGDGMIGDSLTAQFGDSLEGAIGTAPGSDNDGTQMFSDIAGQAGIDGSSVYAGESYDAAALLILAMAQAGSTSAADYAPEVMNVANGPGE